MAITKIKKITTRLDRTVNYALNSEKTDLVNALDYVLNSGKTSDEQILYESAINCTSKTAFADMIATKKAHRNTDGILGYHIMQSFKPNETTPAIAHEIGVKLAQKCFGDRYEVVIGTHLDRNHLHNHIIVNSVSFIDGKKYRNKISNYYDDIRGNSDRLCREYGLSVITQQVAKSTLTYSEWLARNKGKMSWQALIRMDIDDCMKRAFNYGNFLMLMESRGYVIKQGKYLAVKPYGKEHYSRTYKLGAGYDVESIKAKIVGKDLKQELAPAKVRYKDFEKLYQKGKAKGFQALILHYMYILGVIRRNEAPEKVSKLFREDFNRGRIW